MLPKMHNVLYGCLFGLLAGLLKDTSAKPLSGEQVQSSCGAHHLAKYNVTFQTFWSEERFPKQYPVFRPNAQWTKLIGRSHSDNYNMWSLAETCSPSVKEFVERGVSYELDKEFQGEGGILDAFNTLNIPIGIGSVSAKFVVDPYHSKVTTIARIVPSPDWFVGVDSLDLCEDGEWKQSFSLDLDPLDAGTDKGFTFSAPNWQEIPQRPITKITSKVPNHPANSFYYPEMDSLPTMARLSFMRVELMEPDPIVSTEDASSEMSGSVDQTLPGNEVRQKQPHEYFGETEQAHMNLGELMRHDEIIKGEGGYQNTEAENYAVSAVRNKDLVNFVSREEESDGEPGLYRTIASHSQTEQPRGQASVTISEEDRKIAMRKQEKAKQRQIKKEKRKQKKLQKKKSEAYRKSLKARKNGPINCKVTKWSEWTPCSKTCGYGKRSHIRTVVRKPQNSGMPCPALLEDEMCGSMRSCGWSHFSMNNWDN